MGQIIITLIVVAAIVAGVIVWRNRFETYHFATVRPGILYRDGNRGIREFSTAIRKANIRTVVMLIDDREMQKELFQSEVEFCKQRGINVVRVPVTLGERPQTDEVRRFLDVAADPKNHPVLVHCAQGVRRTAMIVAAYQMSAMGYGREQTKKAILPWGRKYDSLADIRGFIDDYDAETRTVGSEHVVHRPQDKD